MRTRATPRRHRQLSLGLREAHSGGRRHPRAGPNREGDCIRRGPVGRRARCLSRQPCRSGHGTRAVAMLARSRIEPGNVGSSALPGRRREAEIAYRCFDVPATRAGIAPPPCRLARCPETAGERLRECTPRRAHTRAGERPDGRERGGIRETCRAPAQGRRAGIPLGARATIGQVSARAGRDTGGAGRSLDPPGAPALGPVAGAVILAPWRASSARMRHPSLQAPTSTPPRLRSAVHERGEGGEARDAERVYAPIGAPKRSAPTTSRTYPSRCTYRILRARPQPPATVPPRAIGPYPRPSPTFFPPRLAPCIWAVRPPPGTPSRAAVGSDHGRSRGGLGCRGGRVRRRRRVPGVLPTGQRPEPERRVRLKAA